MMSCNENTNSKNDNAAKTASRFDSIFDKNGILQEVKSFKGERLSYILFYNSEHAIRKVIKYMKINNEVYPNQFIEMNNDGDTLHDKSLYYDFFYAKDTIHLNEKYNFKVVLTGHIFDSALIYLCNFDENFNLDTSKSACDIFHMKNLEMKLETPAKKNGWNYVRAKIDNYQNYKNCKGKDSSAYASVYLLDSFYVKE